MSWNARVPISGPEKHMAVSYNSAGSITNKYLAVYVLFAVIAGGVVLVASLFFFCRYCKGSKTTSLPRKTSSSIEEWSVQGEAAKRQKQTSLSDTPSNLGSTKKLHDEHCSGKLITEHGKQGAYYQCRKSNKSLDRTSSCYVNPTEETREREITAEVHNVVASAVPARRTSNTSGGSRTSNRPASRPNSHNRNREYTSGSEGEQDTEEKNSYRIPSIDWTHLETSLDFWRKEHYRTVARSREEDVYTSKVRYNDTGSLEEVNVEHLVDYYVEDEVVPLQVEVPPIHSGGDNMRQQYKKLWQLRATLEEDEGKPASELISYSSADQSPDTTEHPGGGSHTTSFESNTEPLLEEHSGSTTKWVPHPLQPGLETRQQTYRNVLSWRLRKIEARKYNGMVNRQSTLEDTSFDSVDTADTEGSSDASRLEQTTSFESTTDNTDSPSESQVHRLQQLRADSGYRSLENPCIKQRLINLGESSDMEVLVKSHRIPSVGDSVDECSESELPSLWNDALQTETKHPTPKKTYLRHNLTNSDSVETENDEGVSMKNKVTAMDTSQWEQKRRLSEKTASRKRREFGGRNDLYQRDYSIDEKSDALFKEFSRCDNSEQRTKFTVYRRLRSEHTPYPKLIENGNGLEEEYTGSYLCTEDETHLATLPIVRLINDEDSSDHI